MENYVVSMQHINKAFPGVQALSDASLQLQSGEVMALLGENGAGKSTLMKVLSGIYQPDSGEIFLNGELVSDLTPIKAQHLGISIIHQELNLCQHLNVAENVFLGREPVKMGRVDEHRMIMETQKILDKLKIEISPTANVSDLSVSKQQMVEIAKALSTNARILIMDEPTSALTVHEIDVLFEIIKTLKAEGVSIVYISHRLEELRQIVDHVTVMRDGQYVYSSPFADTSIEVIIKNMVGREIKEKYPRITTEKGNTVLEVKHISAGSSVKDISFSLATGEIVGIAGLMGAGRTELTRAIVGVDHRDSGEIILDGLKVEINKPADAIKAGVVLVPEDRKKDGLCTKLSIRENIALSNMDMLADPVGVVSAKKEKNMVQDMVGRLQIKLASPEVDAGSLSGGNQQKVVLSKWLPRDSKVIIFDEPTRGIDVAAKVEIYSIMNQLKESGVGVLFVSSELPEVLGISDRILVMCDGRITADMDVKDATQENIMEYATRFEQKA